MMTDPERTIVPPETPPSAAASNRKKLRHWSQFLLSGDAAAITGQEISICGGASL